MKFGTLVYLVSTTIMALALGLLMPYIGVRCIVEGNTVQMGLGWVLVGLGLLSILGGVYNVSETLSDK